MEGAEEGDPGEEGVVVGEGEGGSVTGGERGEEGEREGQWRTSSWRNARAEETESSGSRRAPTW